MRGIRYVSFNENSGYGISASRYIRGLLNAGIPVSWTPLAPGRGREPGLWYGVHREASRTDPVLDPLCMRTIDHDVVLVHAVPEYFPGWRQREPDRFLAAYTTWETDRLPDHWPALINCVDLLLVPCAWNREVMRRSGVKVPIEVVPHISDPVTPDRMVALQASPMDTVFYTINAWTWRKALWRTVEAYLEAFTGDDDTLLVVKTGRDDLTRRGFWRYRPSTAGAVRAIRKRYSNPARIQLIDRELCVEEIGSLHARAHCFVSLTHSEGWGMGAFDAARAGNQVVMTGYGGHLDFLPSELAYLVEYDMVPVYDPRGGQSYTGRQRWARANLADAVAKLRRVKPVDNTALRELVEARFNSRVVTSRLLECLSAYVR